MNSERCPKCHTRFTEGPTHCPACGFGAFSADPAKHQPDLAITTPLQVIAFAKAMRDRMDVTSGLMRRYYQECQIWGQTDPFFLSDDKPEFIKTFEQNMLDATTWTGYTNLDPITDPMRGIVAAYQRIFEHMANIRLQSQGIVDFTSITAKELEEDLKLALEIEEHAYYGINLLIDLQRDLLQYGLRVHADQYTLQDRYYINSYVASFKLLQNAIDDVERLDQYEGFDERMGINIELPIMLLEASTAAAKIENVPPHFKESFDGQKQYASVILEYIANMRQANAEVGLEKVIWEYHRINPIYRKIVEDIHQVSLRMAPPKGI